MEVLFLIEISLCWEKNNKGKYEKEEYVSVWNKGRQNEAMGGGKVTRLVGNSFTVAEGTVGPVW
jgi:hypothetical protein